MTFTVEEIIEAALQTASDELLERLGGGIEEAEQRIDRKTVEVESARLRLVQQQKEFDADRSAELLSARLQELGYLREWVQRTNKHLPGFYPPEIETLLLDRERIVKGQREKAYVKAETALMTAEALLWKEGV